MKANERKTSMLANALRRLSGGGQRLAGRPRQDISLTEQGGGWRKINWKKVLATSEKETLEENEDPNSNLVCSITESPYYVFTACARGLIDVVSVLLSENPNRIHESDQNGRTCLHHAASRGRLEVMRILSQHEPDINAKDNEGDTPLHVAVQKGQTEAVRQLLLAGADGNILNNRNLAPIHLATMANQPRILEVLTSFPNLVDVNCRGEHGKRALHVAAKYDYEQCVDILLRAGCRLCEPCDNGFYPIHVATTNSSVKALRAVLAYGAHCGYSKQSQMLSYADKESNSPLHLAVNSGNYEVVRICLEHGAIIDARQESQATAFHFACSQGTLPIVKLMFEHHLRQRGDTEGRTILSATDNAEMTPLHRAAMFDHMAVVQYLIDQGADIDSLDWQRCSPLLLAAGKGAMRSVKLLVERGADITMKDKIKRHILHFPVVYNCPKLKEAMEIIDLICQRPEGIELLNMKDSFGRTPLHVASKEGHLKLAEALMKFGAIITLKDNEDQSALHFAARYGRYNTVRRLLDSPAGTNVLNETDSNGMTALHAASANGHLKVVELLLERGALLHKNYLGQTPLHVATVNGYALTMKLLLLFHGTLIDQKCRRGYTALHYACEENQAEAAELLLSSNCQCFQNNDDLYPFDIAIQRRHVEVATMFVQHERWKELLKTFGPFGCPILSLIQHLPEVHKIVLDRSLSKSDTDRTSRDYWVKYDFDLLQVPLDKMKEIRQKGTAKELQPLLALNTMVRYGRVELLSHPLSLNFLAMKWAAYGMWFFMIHMALYVGFVCCLTYPITLGTVQFIPDLPANLTNESDVTEHKNTTNLALQTGERKLYHCLLPVAYVVLFAFTNMIKEVIQLYQQRWRYVFDWINYVEWTMYITAIVYSAPAFYHQKVNDAQWQCASVALFLAWFNLLLYLQRLETVGLYVVMFLQILNTVIKVIIVFTVLFVAFGLAFFMLLSTTPNGSYKTPVFAILQALMDLMGEYNYADVYVRPYFQLDGTLPLRYATLNFIFLVIFVVLMPILFVNLLIGLAVGDIEMVQRDARLKRLAMQVSYHTELEEKLPLWLLQKVDKCELVISRSNMGKKGICSRLIGQMHWICDETIMRLAESIWNSGSQAEITNSVLVGELDTLRRRMKELQAKTSNMHDMLRLIVQKMEIVTEADTYEGKRQSDEEEEEAGHRQRGRRMRGKVNSVSAGKIITRF